MQIELTPAEMVLVYVSLVSRRMDIQSLANNQYVSPEIRADHIKDLEMIKTVGEKLFPSSVGG